MLTMLCSDDEEEKTSKKRKAEDQPAKESEGDEEPASLWVGNLPWSCDGDALYAWGQSVGGDDVTDARVITDRETGRSRG